MKRKGRIGESVEKEVQDKIERLAFPRGKSVRTVLVYDGDVDPQVEEDGYFDYLVPIEKFFDSEEIAF
jgi:hypothetical protein